MKIWKVFYYEDYENYKEIDLGYFDELEKAEKLRSFMKKINPNIDYYRHSIEINEVCSSIKNLGFKL